MTGLEKDLLEDDIGMLSGWKSGEVMELNEPADHVQLVVSRPPRISVSELMGSLKGKLAIRREGVFEFTFCQLQSMAYGYGFIKLNKSLCRFIELNYLACR